MSICLMSKDESLKAAFECGRAVGACEERVWVVKELDEWAAQRREWASTWRTKGDSHMATVCINDAAAAKDIARVIIAKIPQLNRQREQMKNAVFSNEK